MPGTLRGRRGPPKRDGSLRIQLSRRGSGAYSRGIGRRSKRGPLSRSGACAAWWTLPCVVLAGCLDLELPPVSADGGVGPDLTVLRPGPGDTIALSAAVEVQAASVNGVASVTVTCGGAPSTGGVLLGEDRSGLVFYVDPLNNEAVALKP